MGFAEKIAENMIGRFLKKLTIEPIKIELPGYDYTLYLFSKDGKDKKPFEIDDNITSGNYVQPKNNVKGDTE